MRTKKKAQDIYRYAKGSRTHMNTLKIVLDPRSVPCPECDDESEQQPCLRCLNTGWVIVRDAALGDTE